MSETIVVEKITTKEGSSDKGPWVRTGIKDKTSGNWFSTFKPDMVAGAKEGATAKITYTSKVGDHGPLYTLTSFELVGNGAPDAYSQTKPDGSADWDKKDLGKTRCALWKSFLEGGLASALFSKALADNAREETQRDPLDHVLITGTRIVVAAERDIFERLPGDDGIPL